MKKMSLFKRQKMIEITPENYIIDGRQFIRVSTLIKKFGLMPNYFSGGNAIEFGTNVHKACEYYDKGILDLNTLDPALNPYLSTWQKFMTNYKIGKWDEIEETVISKIFGFAGTLDREFEGNIFDIKTGQPSAWHGVQLALYKIAYEEMTHKKVVGMYCVYLNSDIYMVKWYNNKVDISVAMAMLTLRNWNKDNKKGD